MQDMRLAWYARAGVVVAMLLACSQCAGVAPAPARSTAPAAPLIAGCTVVLRAGASINAALSVAAPGTSICLDDGFYTPALFTRSGAPGAWITLRAVNPGKATIIAVGKSAQAVNLNAQSYIEVRDLVVDGGSFGIVSSGFAHHTRVIGNEVKFTAASGIQLNDGDYRDIEHNRVHDCAKGWSGSGSGISIYHATASDHSARTAQCHQLQPLLRQRQSSRRHRRQRDHLRRRQSQPVRSIARTTNPALIEENIVYGNGGGGINVVPLIAT